MHSFLCLLGFDGVKLHSGVFFFFEPVQGRYLAVATAVSKIEETTYRRQDKTGSRSNEDVSVTIFSWVLTPTSSPFAAVTATRVTRGVAKASARRISAAIRIGTVGLPIAVIIHIISAGARFCGRDCAIDRTGTAFTRGADTVPTKRYGAVYSTRVVILNPLASEITAA